jgi:hypothetical protein
VEEGPSYPVAPFLAHIREEVTSADRAWRAVAGDAPPEEVRVRLYLPTNRATPAALALYALDRETRRATVILQQGFGTDEPRETVARTFRPLPVKDGGLALNSAQFASADLFLVAFGVVSQALLSNPVQLTLTVKELLGWGRLVVRVRHPFLDREREAVDLRRGFRVKSNRKGVSVEGVPEGTRVTVEHRLADGTETKIEVDRS